MEALQKSDLNLSDLNKEALGAIPDTRANSAPFSSLAQWISASKFIKKMMGNGGRM